MTSLRDLPADCFDGVIPSLLATCAEDGTPNATWLSQVYLAGDRHVALSCQFFRKTRANLDVQKKAQLFVVEARLQRQWRLDLVHVRRETEGAMFDAMKARIEAIASATGMHDVFALQSADVFEVLGVEAIVADVEPVEESRDGAALGSASADPLDGLARLTDAVAACNEVGALVETGLASLCAHFGFERVSLYVLEESEDALYTLASRGFDRSGVGARVPLGAGVVGASAERRVPIRIVDAPRELIYRRAIEEQVERAHDREREIAVPGLEGAGSVLAVPLVVRGKLFGVLSTESRARLAFSERDAKMLATAGQVLAQAVALLEAAGAAGGAERDDPPPAPSLAPESKVGTRVRYYEADDSVFVDDEYVIKGLPGRILWLLLTMRESEKRTTFSNRELRLHPFLKLPSYKDNLETRLLMLQRRLDERALPLRIVREQRGRVELVCPARVELERVG